MSHDPARRSTSALLAEPSALKAASMPLDKLIERIGHELSTMPHLAGLRNFNHANLDAVTQQFTGNRSTARVLDVGASIHGFALEKAAALGFSEYIGIDLDVQRQWGTHLLQITQDNRSHVLCQMDAHRLWFEDESMDVVLCLSGFEHYLFPELVVREVNRVLKPGGIALINYEPIWTCSYGHHLHHFGLGYDQVPPWSHLFMSKSQMHELLADKNWPAHCPVTKSQAVEWIYTGREINRRDCRFHRDLLAQIPCSERLWLEGHADPAPQALSAVDYVSSLLPYTRDELLTRGFSCCYRK